MDEIYKLMEVEKICYEAGLAVAREIFRHTLEACEEEIRINRNKNATGRHYKNIVGRNLTYKTIMGEVDVVRRYYKYTDEKTGEDKHIYLLDEKLKGALIGKMTMNVALYSAQLITEQSYREVAERVSEVTSLAISPQAVWNLIQGLAERLNMECSHEKKPTEEEARKVVEVIFEEADGVYIKMRGSDRPEDGHAREMKIATFYEGFRMLHRNKNKEEYECVGKRYITSFGNPQDFFEKKEDYLAQFYKTEKIGTRLINHDGAAWIGNVYSYPRGKVYKQLDPYHRNKVLRKSGLSKDQIHEIMGYFRHHEIQEVFKALQRIYHEVEEEKKKSRIAKIYEYYYNSRKILIPIMERGISNLPKLKRGLEYRSLGTMESSVGNVVGRRLKKRKAAWSIRGAENITRLIGLKLCGDMKSCIANITGEYIKIEEPDDDFSEILSASAIRVISGKGYKYPVTARLPIEKSTLSEYTRKAIKGLLNDV